MNDIIAVDNVWRFAFVARNKDSKVLGELSMTLAKAVDVFLSLDMAFDLSIDCRHRESEMLPRGPAPGRY
jgi:hypothetical protein